MFENIEDLYNAIQGCDLLTVIAIVDEDQLDINDTENYNSPPLIRALMRQQELKESEETTEEQCLNITGIIRTLLLAPRINYHARGYDDISAYEYVISQDDATTFEIMFNKDPSLFKCNADNVCPYEYAFDNDCPEVQAVLECVQPSSQKKINEYVSEGKMIQAIYCFMHKFATKEIESQRSNAMFRILLYWALAEQLPSLVSKLLTLEVPTLSAAEGNCILNIITTQFTNRKILGFFTPTLSIAAESLFVTILLEANNANLLGAFCNRIKLCKLDEDDHHITFYKSSHSSDLCAFMCLILHKQETWPVLAAPLTNLNHIYKYLILKNLIAKQQTGFVQYLLNETFINIRLAIPASEITISWYLFAIQQGDIEVANFYIQYFAEANHYELLRDFYSLPIKPNFAYVVMLAWLDNLTLAQVNELIVLGNVKYDVDTIALLPTDQRRKLLKWLTYVQSPTTMCRLALVDQIIPEEDSSLVEFQLHTIETKIYADLPNDFAIRYAVLVDRLKQWLRDNDCSSEGAINVFWSNMSKDVNAIRHMLYNYRMNYSTEVKQALELIYYNLTENQQIPSAKKKACMTAMCDQIDKCGPGSRQAIEDCLISLGSADIRSWLGDIKLDLLRKTILQANLLDSLGSTHFIIWANKYMQSLGYDIPTELFADTTDDLFEINNSLTPLQIDSLKRDLQACYRSKYSLNLIVERAIEQFLAITRNEAGLPEDWESNAVILQDFRVLGLTYTEISGEVKIFKDIFCFSPSAIVLANLREFIATYSTFDDPELLQKYDLRLFPHGRSDAALEDIQDKEFFHIILEQNNIKVTYKLQGIIERFTLSLNECPEINTTNINCIYAILKRAIRQQMTPNIAVAKFHILDHLRLNNLLYPLKVTDFSFWQPGAPQEPITNFPTIEFSRCDLQLIMLGQAISIYANYTKSTHISNAIQRFPLERLNDHEFSDLLNAFNNPAFYQQLRATNSNNGYLAQGWVNAHLALLPPQFIPIPNSVVPPPPPLFAFTFHPPVPPPPTPPPSPKRLRV